MPNETPHSLTCSKCMIHAYRPKFLGIVAAGAPTDPRYYQEDEPHELEEFVGYRWSLPTSHLTSHGIASGDTLMISTDRRDLTQRERQTGRIVVAIDPHGIYRMGRLDTDVIRDDRGAYYLDGLNIIGIVSYIVKEL